MQSASPVSNTTLDGLTLHRRGKVRDVYELGDDLLIVATDRISAFDYVLGTAIPDKGKVLTQLSAFWFGALRDVVPNHLITTDISQFPEPARRHAASLEGRSMLVRRTAPLPIECVARGYLSGSGWKEYRETGTVCGIRLPVGLRESDRLPEPIFTPATKAEAGHDINIGFEEAAAIVGDDVVARVRDLTLELYRRGAAHAAARGIIVADTKFEFGFAQGSPRQLILIDEALTPDSSRFWPMDEYEPGTAPPSFDKQYVRDYLEGIRWNKQPPVPLLPDEVVQRTREKYLEAFRLITGRELAPWSSLEIYVREKLDQLVEEMLDKGIRFEDVKREVEKRFIGRALARSDGSVSRAAALLGLHRNTLSRKMEEYKIRRLRGR